ncbi:hypothetical protein BN2127_JRS9_03370 [Bacillus subtilis]|uniref:DUF3991 and TOPRIM domain-containing protein n=1 Tax=Bacillus subtilis TaxID=1423 RepID=UPI0006A87961|nr:DUF3991 and TOPRIM domain-containing protein [Bacillus subtilis]CUB20621.1 hypothetical protein BN2127_JRS2_03369 [Bacillus subtilis]CUB58314.1 hypothetical protein BN2127_JRS9_03370 [Bacillus subtilis]
MPRVSEDVIKQAAAVDIVGFCEANGYELVKMSDRWYQGAEHDSLMIDRKKNSFQWFSQGKNGNSIDFVRTFYGKSFREAVSMLTEKDYKHTKEVKEQPQKEFVYDIVHDNSTEQVERYLTEERGIDKGIVNALIAKGLLRQDKKKNCVFVWGNTGKRVGADLQGTITMNKDGKRTTFKQIKTNSQRNYGFNVSLGVPKKLYFFEAPIDLLSYWTMYKDQLSNCRLISMNGVKKNTVFNLIKHTMKSRGVAPTEGVYFGVDNDHAGHKFMDEIRQYEFSVKGEEVKFHNLIPADNHIPKEYLELYQTYGRQYGVDWKYLAAIHKAETNLGNTNEITNGYGFGKYFGAKQLPSEKPYEIQVPIAIEEAARALKANTIDGKTDLGSVLKQDVKEVDLTNQVKMQQKVQLYYDNYNDLGYLPVEEVSKDWNDVLKVRRAASKHREKTHSQKQHRSKKNMLVRG